MRSENSAIQMLRSGVSTTGTNRITRLYRFSVFFLFWVVAFGTFQNLIACKTRSSDEKEQFRQLFEGFELIKVDDLPKGQTIAEIVPLKLQNRFSSTDTLVPGRIYIFRNKLRVSDEVLGMDILPKRLESIGMRVVTSPRSSKDFMYPVIGGPLFFIRFSTTGLICEMRNYEGSSLNHEDYRERLLTACFPNS